MIFIQIIREIKGMPVLVENNVKYMIRIILIVGANPCLKTLREFIKK
jgi:hypothetical protein